MRRSFFALALFACGDQEVFAGADEPLVVEKGQFIEGTLPGSPPSSGDVAPRATAATTPSSNLRSYLAGIDLSGWATLDAVAVAARFEGLGTGYWVIPTGPQDPAVQGEPVRTWRFTANLGDVPPGPHRLLVAATNAEGQAGTQIATTLCIQRRVPDNGNACDVTKPPPDMVVSLEWDSEADLDLAIVTPQNETINAKTPARGEAFLDADSNVDCKRDGHHLENIVFPKITPGSYLVYANLHAACGHRSVHYTVARHTRIAGATEGTYSVLETDRTHGTLIAVQQNGSTQIGTFVTELVVP